MFWRASRIHGDARDPVRLSGRMWDHTQPPHPHPRPPAWWTPSAAVFISTLSSGQWLPIGVQTVIWGCPAGEFLPVVRKSTWSAV